MNLDQITQDDYISQCYWDKEQHIASTVRAYNQQLLQPLLQLSFFDSVRPVELYGQTQRVFLTGPGVELRSPITGLIVEFDPEVYGIYYMPNHRWHRNTDRDFNCLMSRLNPVRQSWFYMLYVKGLLDRGYVSLNIHTRINDQSDPYYNFDKFHQETLNGYDQYYHEIRQLVPFKNFEETGNVCDTILLSKFSIVIETYFNRPDTRLFTEKTFRALQTPRPWLLFHATNTVEQLRDWGFYVYDDMIDHSYDKFDTAQKFVQRQDAILAQLEELNKIKITSSMFDHWEKQTIKNREILSKWHSSWQQSADTTISQAFELAKNIHTHN